MLQRIGSCGGPCKTTFSKDTLHKRRRKQTHVSMREFELSPPIPSSPLVRVTFPPVDAYASEISQLLISSKYSH